MSPQFVLGLLNEAITEKRSAFTSIAGSSSGQFGEAAALDKIVSASGSSAGALGPVTLHASATHDTVIVRIAAGLHANSERRRSIGDVRRAGRVHVLHVMSGIVTLT